MGYESGFRLGRDGGKAVLDLSLRRDGGVREGKIKPLQENPMLVHFLFSERVVAGNVCPVVLEGGPSNARGMVQKIEATSWSCQYHGPDLC